MGIGKETYSADSARVEKATLRDNGRITFLGRRTCGKRLVWILDDLLGMGDMVHQQARASIWTSCWFTMSLDRRAQAPLGRCAQER